MVDLNNQHVQGGPVQPVYIMNGLPGDPNRKDDGGVSVVSTTVSAVGPTSVIASPGAGYRIVVHSFVIQNESATASTAYLQDQVTRWRVLGQSQGDGLAMVFDAMQPWKLNANTALYLRLSAAVQWGISVQYSIEAV